MVNDAISNYPNYIIVDDSSRFARSKKVAVDTKHKLRSHGVNIRFVNEPFIDPKSVSGIWLEGIQEIKNEATSREISYHVRKGMSYNIQARDPETGWCYKNGGKAPFGYKIIYLQRGQSHNGKPILKSNWVLNEETSPIVKEIIVEMYINKKMSYNDIRNELNNRRIKTNRGNTWTTSSVATLLSKDRLKTYAGYGIWNKIDKDTIGRRNKPKDEWIIVEDAHPSIITEEELQLALIERNIIEKELH